MELYQVRYFLAVAETLNFTRASERSFVSQPALTKAIQRLEETLGGRLFDRGKSAVQLTDFGRALLPSLQQVYDSAMRAREEARRLSAPKREKVRVGVMCTIAFEQLLPGFAEALDGHGAVRLSFREGNLEALTDALDRGEIELGLMCSPNETPRRFERTPLYHEDYVLAIGDDHRFHGRAEVPVAELDREHYCDRIFCEFSSHIERLLDERGVTLHTVQQSAREDWIQALVRANVGVAFMPESLALAAGLDHVRLVDLPIVREVALLRVAERPFSAAQQAVADALRVHPWPSRLAALRHHAEPSDHTASPP